MNKRSKAFTLVELLTVIAIISLLLGLALPALNEARLRAREVGDRASLSTIGVGCETFANDMGFYPESSPTFGVMRAEGLPDFPGNPPDQGAHRLMEALLGWDLLGYQKAHFYDVFDDTGEPRDFNGPTRRWGPYIEPGKIELGDMETAHAESSIWGGNPNSVFLDTLSNDNQRAILYYRAHSSKFRIGHIFEYQDNAAITTDQDGSGSSYHEDFDNYDDTQYNNGDFENFIFDPRTGFGNSEDPSARPYNKDSFILINAGRDHEYGTPDDITNYTRR